MILSLWYQGMRNSQVAAADKVVPLSNIYYKIEYFGKYVQRNYKIRTIRIIPATQYPHRHKIRR